MKGKGVSWGSCTEHSAEALGPRVRPSPSSRLLPSLPRGSSLRGGGPELRLCSHPKGGASEGAGPAGRGLGGAGPRGGAGGSQFLTHGVLLPQPSEFEEEASRRVDDLLESYMGIRDPELGKGPG